MLKKLLLLAVSVVLTGCGSIVTEPASKPYNSSKTLKDVGLSPLHNYALYRAVEGWNKGLGFEYFKFSSYGTVTLKTSGDRQYFPDGLFAVGLFIGNKHRGEIIIKDSLTKESFSRMVIYHELGHSIGLDHNENRLSIMYPIADELERPAPITSDFIQALRIIQGKEQGIFITERCTTKMSK